MKNEATDPPNVAMPVSEEYGLTTSESLMSLH